MNKKKLKDIKAKMDGSADREEKISEELSDSFEGEQKNMFKAVAKKVLEAAKEFFKEQTKESERLVYGEINRYQSEVSKDIQAVIKTISQTKKDLSDSNGLTKKDIDFLKGELDALVNEHNDHVSGYGLKVEGLDESLKELYSILDTLDNRVSAAVQPVREDMLDFDKRLLGVSKEIFSIRENGNASFKSFGEIENRFKRLDEELKKMSKGLYEYGNSFAVLKNGVLQGQTNGINFAAGTNTTVTATVNAQGFITIAINATSGSGFVGSQEKSTTVPDGVLTTFAFAHTPAIIVWNGQVLTLTDDYTVSSLNITFTGSAGVPKIGDKIVNIYA